MTPTNQLEIANKDQIAIEAFAHKAQYRPGEQVTIVINTKNGLERDVAGNLEVRISHLVARVATLNKSVELRAGTQQQFSLEWPAQFEEHLHGYGVDIRFCDLDGQVLAETSTAFDVVSDWTSSPRYGFLCDFARHERDSAERLLAMNKFHINAIQFYDWMYRHDTLLPPGEEFRDPLGRQLSLKTIQNKIALAHQYNMAAMAYTAVYGASKEFHLQHEDWALYRADGRSRTLDLHSYGDFLYIMNPQEGTPWRKHLLKQYQATLQALDFDGIHIDQYGAPKFGFNEKGNLVHLASAFSSFIDETKAALLEIRADAKVVFNAVNNWPIRAVAPAEQDLVYVEVWPPHITYQDLAMLINQGRELSGGKKVVLAAYIPPTSEASVRLANAVIFASGGFHIEIGEFKGMLADPYFPKYQAMDIRIASAMKDYYDFLVRYGNILHDGVEDTDALPLWLDNIQMTNCGEPNAVWVIPKRKGNLLMINLINLLDAHCLWKEEQKEPRILSNIQTKFFLPGSARAMRVYLASPDFNHCRPIALDFKNSPAGIELVIPRLTYWDLLIVEINKGLNDPR